MLYHYIFQNQFITSDEELDPSKYSIGLSLNDYILGKYIPLNNDLIEYMNNNPMASPEEVFEMKSIGMNIHVKTPYDLMLLYFDDTHNIVYINNEVHKCWDHREILYNAQLAKIRNREEFIFLADGKYFKGNTDDIIDMMQLISLYYYDYKIATDLHYRYLQKHPEELGTYDYTTGFPEVLHFTLLEVYDFD